MTQEQLAKKLNRSQGFISLLIKGSRVASWPVAKKLGKITNTDPVIWMETGRQHTKRQALKKAA